MVSAKPEPVSTFKLRDRLRTKQEELTEKQILKRIASGKLTGEEEISLPPYEEWHKLSAHPRFFDAFIKRIYEGQYEPPEPLPDVSAASEAKSKSKSKSRSKVSGTGSGSKARAKGAKDSSVMLELNEDAAEAGDNAGRTQHLPEDGGGGTVNNSAFKDLFSISAQHPQKEAVFEQDKSKSLKLGTDLIKVDSADNLPGVALPEPMDHQGYVTEEESPEVVALRKKQAARQRLKLFAGVALLLVGLFYLSGNDKPKPPPAETAKSKPSSLIKDVVVDATTKEERMKTLVEEGDRLYENDMPLFYLGAQELFNEALAYSEANAIILGRLAEATARLIPESTKEEGLAEEVGRLVGRGRAKDPQFTQFYRAEALANLYSGKLDEAKESITHALEADPNNAENALVRGEILFIAGDLNAAKEGFEEVLKSNPASVRARYFASRIAFEQNNLSKAEMEALNTLKLNPIHAASFALLGQVAMAKNKAAEAKQLLDTGVGLAKFGPRQEIAKAHLARAAWLETNGQKEEANRSYALAHYYDSSLKNFPKEKLKGLNLSDETLIALSQDSEYGRAYFSEQANTLQNQKKFREAYLFLEAAYLIDPNDGNGLVKLGELTEKMATSYDDFRTVVSFYQRAILKDPSLTKAYIKLGLLESEQYNLERALKLLKQAEALSPQESDPYVALGKHFYRSKDYFSAIEQFTKAFKINPADSEILYYAGLLRLLARKEGEKEATNFFYRSYLLDPQNYDALVEWLKLKVQNYEKTFAIKFVLNLLEQDQGNANLYWALGEVYATNKEFRRAINYYHKALDADNRSARVRLALAKSLEAVGEIESAVAEYRLASFLDRRNGEGFYRAADLLFQAKKYKDAEEVLNYLVSVSPNYPGAHRYLSKIFQASRQKDRAVASMQREVTNNPMNAKYRIEYAELLMDYGKLDESIKELTEVTNLPPVAKAPEFAYDKIRSYLLLSRAFRLQSKFESAEGAINLALENDRDDPELHRELGYVYHAQQRDKEAVKEFQYYIAKNPTAPDVEQMKRLIENLEIQE